MTKQELIDLMDEINALAPYGIVLVKTLVNDLKGKTDEELKAAGDAIDDAGIAKADAEINKLA